MEIQTQIFVFKKETGRGFIFTPLFKFSLPPLVVPPFSGRAPGNGVHILSIIDTEVQGRSRVQSTVDGVTFSWLRMEINAEFLSIGVRNVHRTGVCLNTMASINLTVTIEMLHPSRQDFYLQHSILPVVTTPDPGKLLWNLEVTTLEYT
jgi:hypothetical protein